MLEAGPEEELGAGDVLIEAAGEVRVVHHSLRPVPQLRVAEAEREVPPPAVLHVAVDSRPATPGTHPRALRSAGRAHSATSASRCATCHRAPSVGNAPTARRSSRMLRAATSPCARASRNEKPRPPPNSNRSRQPERARVGEPERAPLELRLHAVVDVEDVVRRRRSGG